MSLVNKFYVKHAVYQVEVDGEEAVLLLNYAGNSYEVVGEVSERIQQIALGMLAKKHGINFAYKFNDKIEGSKYETV